MCIRHSQEKEKEKAITGSSVVWSQHARHLSTFKAAKTALGSQLASETARPA